MQIGFSVKDMKVSAWLWHLTKACVSKTIIKIGQSYISNNMLFTFTHMLALTFGKSSYRE